MNITCNSAIPPEQFQQLLLQWFEHHGRKQLPWQIDKTAYKVMVSEVMLQQTQVTTVIPYFLRFMNVFPQVEALAKAKIDEVLHLWSGLGYYRRAHHLHQAAVKIVQEFTGIIPADIVSLQTLPGIGLSTASAIRALAFDLPATILDGNVKRVLTRLHGIFEPVNTAIVEKKLRHIAEYYTPSSHAAAYTQAMMDMGATICTPRSPNCAACPLRALCSTEKNVWQEQLPIKVPKKKLPIKEATFLVFKRKQSILMQKRQSERIWQGLWSLPEINGKPQQQQMQIYCQQQFGLKKIAFELLPAFSHVFTHFRLNLYPVLIKSRTKPATMPQENMIWYDLTQPQRLGLPKPIQTILEAI